jgi:hypothetical protein
MSCATEHHLITLFEPAEQTNQILRIFGAAAKVYAAQVNIGTGAPELEQAELVRAGR